MAKSFVFLADGFEDIEALGTVDILRRAGIHTVTVAVGNSPVVKSAHGIPVTADIKIEDADTGEAQWLILPGGMPGATNLAASGRLNDMLTNQWHEERGIAAICASPAVVLAPLGIVRGQQATCYPSFKDELVKGGAQYIADRVAISNNLITANGPSSTFDFALAIVAQTLGTDVASSIASGMLI